jgi:hypothetical protein
MQIAEQTAAAQAGGAMQYVTDHVLHESCGADSEAHAS